MIGKTNEQNIQNSLHHITMEDQSYMPTHKNRYQQRIAEPYVSFKEISDWGNRYRAYPTIQCIKTKTENHKYQQQDEEQTLKNHFIIYKKHRKQNSLCTSSQQKQSLLPTPINVKFHNNPKKDKNSGKRISSYQKKQDRYSGLSIYQVNYRPLSVLYENKQKVKEKYKQRDDEALIEQCKVRKLPKTERISGIMRIMKRNQQVRSFRRKYGNQSLTLNI